MKYEKNLDGTFTLSMVVPHIYDQTTDTSRPATQEDVDQLMSYFHAFCDMQRLFSDLKKNIIIKS